MKQFKWVDKDTQFITTIKSNGRQDYLTVEARSDCGGRQHAFIAKKRIPALIKWLKAVQAEEK